MIERKRILSITKKYPEGFREWEDYVLLVLIIYILNHIFVVEVKIWMNMPYK